MKQMYIADAFTTEKFGGNPAGVVLLKENEDFPSDEVMRKTAAELRYSETAFIRPMAESELKEILAEMTFEEGGPSASDIDGGFQIRYFTPADEVDLCGHATIASYRCLTDAGLCETGGTYLNRAIAGDLFIDVAGDQVLMDMARPQHISTMRAPEELQELYEVMGIDYCDIGMFPQLISTGLPDIIMPVQSRDVLAHG